jgi:hypothetical protein
LEEESEGGGDLMVGPSSGSLDFLRAIYRSPDQPLQRRMRAAIAALPLEHPKLSVSANIGPNVNFAKGLERALKTIRSEPLVIDGTAERIARNVENPDA